MEHEVPHGVHAEHGSKVVRIDDVAAGLAHLLAALQEPGVGKDVVGQRLAERHQKDGPVDGMEAGDVLADDVQLFGIAPEFVIKGRAAVGVVAEPRDIVGESVQPHIDDVAAVKIDGDAPLERRARNAQILQALLQKVVHHLVLAGDGADEIGVRFDVMNERVRVLSHPEEVRLFFGALDFAAAVGAFAVYKLALRPKTFARGAVPALVLALVDIALLIELLEDLLHRPDVARIGGADELVVRSADAVPNGADDTRDVVDIGLRGDARLFRLLFDLLAVFVRARLEADVVALHALETDDGVRQNGFVSVADVRLARSIGDRRRYIIIALHIVSPWRGRTPNRRDAPADPASVTFLPLLYTLFKKM